MKKFIYDDVVVRQEEDKKRKFPIGKFDATAYWVYHYKNWVKLDRISKYCSFQDRPQAEKEILIAQRKMKFWERQDNFDMDRARKEIKL